jgi:hypothetical protein
MIYYEIKDDMESMYTILGTNPTCISFDSFGIPLLRERAVNSLAVREMDLYYGRRSFTLLCPVLSCFLPCLLSCRVVSCRVASCPVLPYFVLLTHSSSFSCVLSCGLSLSLSLVLQQHTISERVERSSDLT